MASSEREAYPSNSKYISLSWVQKQKRWRWDTDGICLCQSARSKACSTVHETLAWHVGMTHGTGVLCQKQHRVKMWHSMKRMAGTAKEQEGVTAEKRHAF